METLTTYALAGLGAVQGAYKYYKPEAATLAWAGIVAYELLAPEGQLLSEGCDRAIDKHPLMVPLAIGVTALHLANLLPDKYDPLHRGLELLK